MTVPLVREDVVRLTVVLLVALNLRGAIAAVGPVLPELRADLGLSPEAAGLLTTLPVLCFAVLAPPAVWLGRRLGTGAAVLAGLVAVAVGTALRVLGGPPLLFAGTFVLGAGMTAGNVCLPVVVKREFGSRAGTVTGLYTAALAAGAALTAAFTAPVAALGGWRPALALWAVLALAAAGAWAVVFPPRPAGAAAPAPAPAAAPGSAPGGPAGRTVWRSPVAWAVTTVLALQSALYYCVTTWLPSLLGERLAVDLGGAALAASVFQVLGIPGALVIPALLGRWRGQAPLAAAIALAWGLLPVGLLVWPAAWPAWVVVGGLAQGAGISLAFALVVLRSADDDVVRRLSGMSQLVGYAIGAVAPLAVGALYAATGGWTVPLVLVSALATGFGVAGVAAGRPVVVTGDRPAAG